MKKFWLLVLVLLILAGVAYAYRHQLKSLMSPANQMAPTGMMVSPTGATPSAMPSANSIYMSKTDTAKGTYLTDPKGMTLYVFDKDTAGVSTCYGGCATTWPAYTATAGAATTNLPTNITLVARTGSAMQYAYKGMPLYYYSGDVKVGDTNGDGIGGIWHIIK